LRKLAQTYAARKPEQQLAPTRHLATLKIWSHRWHWQNRVADWEVILIQREQVDWEERWKVFRQKEFALASLLGTRIEQMMQSPVYDVRRTGPNGQETLIKAAGWTWHDVGMLLERHSKIGRLAIGKPFERSELEKLTDEQLLALHSQLEEQLSHSKWGSQGTEVPPPEEMKSDLEESESSGIGSPSSP
jgi:hypothetical protein